MVRDSAFSARAATNARRSLRREQPASIRLRHASGKQGGLLTVEAVGRNKPPGPAGACHRAGQRPDPVGRPDEKLRALRHSGAKATWRSPKLDRAHALRLLPPTAL